MKQNQRFWKSVILQQLTVHFHQTQEGRGIAWTWNGKEWLPNPILMRTLEVAKRDIEGDIEGTCAPKLKTHRFSLSTPHNLLFIGADMRFPNQILGENYRDPYLYASSCSHGRMNLFQLTDDLKREHP